jgi:hypothetical protein
VTWLRIVRRLIPADVVCLLAASTAAAHEPLTRATTDTVSILSAGPAKPRIMSLVCLLV